MRRSWLFGTALLLAPAMTAAEPDAPPPAAHLCGAAPPAAAPPALKLLAGYGTGGFPVRTASPEAQAWFDNGMQLGHAFAHAAAIAAFQQARKLDPDCAMCAWGEAWARGPTINYTISDKTEAELAAIADRAAALAKDGPEKERRLTAALQLRYHGGGGQGAGDDAFARAMDRIARDYPDDSEIAVLAADAWMIPTANRETKDNLPRAVELLEGVLKRHPNDTGAIHFYIHATEISGFGPRALPYARRLQALAPAASHLTHMPSHTYYWVGDYAAAVRSNADAVVLDEANARRLGKGADGVWKLTYHQHNVMFGTGAALMDGDADAALALAAPLIAYTPRTAPGDLFTQLAAGTAYSAEARYAEPARMLALPDPGAERPYARLMWRYARGEAYARLGEAAAVRAEAAQLAASPELLKAAGPLEPQAAAMAVVTREVLLGRAAMLDGKPREAAALYAHAAGVQETTLKRISDPPVFWYPVRRSYAAALLQAGDARRAAEQARKVLDAWPNDAVALSILARAESAQGDGKASVGHLAQAARAWKGAPLETLAPALL